MHQAVTLRGSPAVMGKQNQPIDSEFTKVAKVTHVHTHTHTKHTIFKRMAKIKLNNILAAVIKF